VISVQDGDAVGVLGRLAGFRREFYRCLTVRPDALFELTDALLCGDTPVRSLVELSLAGEHRRGHGSLYAALNRGRIDIEALKPQDHLQGRPFMERRGPAPSSLPIPPQRTRVVGGKSGRLILVGWFSAPLYPVDRNYPSLVDGSRAPRSTSYMIFESWSASAPLR
jgi:hypothetical protein